MKRVPKHALYRSASFPYGSSRIFCNVKYDAQVGVSKKTGKPIKPRKPEKNNRKNRTEKKPIKFLKKRAGSVRFRFYKQKTEKTEPNRNRQKTGKKPSQTGKTGPKPRKQSQNRKNRAKPVWTGFCPKKPNRNGRFDPVSVRFRFFFQKKKFRFGYFFW